MRLKQERPSRENRSRGRRHDPTRYGRQAGKVSTKTRVFDQTRAARASVDQARVNRWVASRIVTWTPDNCFRCRRPIVYGAKWVELVNDNERARFHADCSPAWRAQQELAARQAMGLDQSERP